MHVYMQDSDARKKHVDDYYSSCTFDMGNGREKIYVQK
jgi:hypothetical protein